MDGWTFYSFQGSAVRNAASADLDLSVGSSELSAGENSPVSIVSGVLPSARFNPPDLFRKKIENEFRQVLNLFISMENRTGNNCPRSFQELVLEAAGELGGFVSCLGTGSDGYSILVVFGAPVSHEDNACRANLFLQKVFSKANGRVKAGAASGLVFSGVLSTPLLEAYTVLGPSVNLAARMHGSAGWNTVYSSPGFNRTSSLELQREKEITLKGISSPAHIFILSPWKQRDISSGTVPPFIERETMLADLNTALNIENTQILITGVTGMGKTRLVDELIKRMRDTFVISMRCEDMSVRDSDLFSRWLGEWIGLQTDEAELTTFRRKLYGFIDLLEEHEDPAAGEVADELLRAESVLAAMVGLHWEKSLYNGLDPRGRFQNTVSVMAAFVRGLCLLQKTVLIFDDLQWIKPGSIKLLAGILRELGNSRPPVLLLARPEPGSSIEELGLTPSEIELQPLTRSGCRQFLEWSLSTEPSEELLDWFYHRTEGIPFFMEQYAWMLTSASELPDEESFPGNIHSLLVARLDRLDSNLKEAVLSASILGRAFNPRVLSAVIPDLDLPEILRFGTAERVWQKTADEQYRFIHILLREAAYNLQLHSDRRRLHAKAAVEMERLWAHLPDRASTVAFHLEMSDNVEDASLWYMKGGRHSFSIRMLTTCQKQMRKVLALSSDVSLRVDAHRMIYDLYASSGDLQKAEEAIEAAASEDLSKKEKARVQLMRVNLATIIGKPQEAQKLLEGIEEANPAMRPHVLNHRGKILMLQAKTEEAMNLLLDVHEELKDGTPEEKLVGIKALGNASGCMLRLNLRAEAESSLKQILAFAMDSGNIVIETLAVGNLALVYKYLLGRYNDAVKMERRHLELARRTGSRLLELQAAGNLGSLLERKASTPEVFELLKKAVDLSRQYGGNEALSISLANLGKGFHRVNEYEKALKFLEEALHICQKEKMYVHRMDYAFEIIHILTDMGWIDKAEEQFTEISEWGITEDYASELMLCKGKLLRLRNKNREAVDLLNEGLEKYTGQWTRYTFLYELYLNTGNREILLESIEQGEQYYAQYSTWELRKRLDELKELK